MAQTERPSAHLPSGLIGDAFKQIGFFNEYTSMRLFKQLGDPKRATVEVKRVEQTFVQFLLTMQLFEAQGKSNDVANLVIICVLCVQKWQKGSRGWWRPKLRKFKH